MVAVPAESAGAAVVGKGMFHRRYQDRAASNEGIGQQARSPPLRLHCQLGLVGLENAMSMQSLDFYLRQREQSRTILLMLPSIDTEGSGSGVASLLLNLQVVVAMS